MIIKTLSLAAVAALSACTTLSPKMQMAEQVSRRVNAEITYQEDAAQYGQSDRWVVYPTSGKGDCEDYALTKLWELKDAGIPSLVQICALDSGVWHAVNVVWDGNKRWVLDNTRPYATEYSHYPCKMWFIADFRKKTIHLGK